MARITFMKPDGSSESVEAQNGLSVMEVAVRHSIPQVEGACGGSLACATCHVYVHPDWWDRVLPQEGDLPEEEEDMLDLAFNLTRHSRLSCQIIVTDDLDGLVVALPGTDVSAWR